MAKVIIKDRFTGKLVALKLKEETKIARIVDILKGRYDHLKEKNVALFYKDKALDPTLTLDYLIREFGYKENDRLEIREQLAVSSGAPRPTGKSAVGTELDLIKMMSKGGKNFDVAVMEILVQAGVLNREIGEKALRTAEAEQEPFITTLIEGAYLPEKDILTTISRQLEIPSVDLEGVKISQEVLKLVPQDVAGYYCIIPTHQKGSVLSVAVTNPFDAAKLDDLRLITGLDIDPVLSTEPSIRNKIKTLYEESEEPEIEVEDTKARVAIRDGQKVDLNSSAEMDGWDAPTVIADEEGDTIAAEPVTAEAMELDSIEPQGLDELGDLGELENMGEEVYEALEAEAEDAMLAEAVPEEEPLEEAPEEEAQEADVPVAMEMDADLPEEELGEALGEDTALEADEDQLAEEAALAQGISIDADEMELEDAAQEAAEDFAEQLADAEEEASEEQMADDLEPAAEQELEDAAESAPEEQMNLETDELAEMTASSFEQEQEKVDSPEQDTEAGEEADLEEPPAEGMVIEPGAVDDEASEAASSEDDDSFEAPPDTIEPDEVAKSIMTEEEIALERQLISEEIESSEEESGEDTAESGEDTAESGEDTAESGEDTAESGEDISESGEDISESGEDTPAEASTPQDIADQDLTTPTGATPSTSETDRETAAAKSDEREESSDDAPLEPPPLSAGLQQHVAAAPAMAATSSAAAAQAGTASPSTPVSSEKDEAQPEITATSTAADEESTEPRELSREANVRYYSQMHPFVTYPLMVILSKRKIQKVMGEYVQQASGKGITVPAQKPIVKIFPHFPGCLVMPPEVSLDVTPRVVSAKIWITPLTEGKIPEARVELWHEGKCIDSIATPTKAVKATMAKVSVFCGLLSSILCTAYEIFGVDLGQNPPKFVVQIAQVVNKAIHAVGGLTNFGFVLLGFFLIVAGFFLFRRRAHEGRPVVNFFDLQEEISPPGMTLES